MKIKEINNKIANVAFSPANLYPIYVASGTASEQNDSNYNIHPTIELYKLDISSASNELELCGSVETESRFSKLIWSDYSSLNHKNLIIGGFENSKICLYDYEKILSNSSSLVQTLEKHTGKVYSLDINPFQHNLLASGASSSDIFIWDLNNPQTPMTPGAKQQPLDDINSVAWNKQVQHILASTSSGKCNVWDLRKNESIIKVSDTMSKMKAKMVAWHPDIATQMCLSSDDDQSPYLQIWDLRFATSPVRVLEGHQRGILAFEWCSLDSNLLVSTGKDSRMLCWNPNNPTVNGEILYDLTTVGQWCFDLSWSKRNPDLICTSSFESQVNVYSLMGGRFNVTLTTSSKIMDSFGVDNNEVPGSPIAMPQQTIQVVEPLKLAPKWMKRPCGARFAFGGKLVTFGKYAETQHAEQINAPSPAQVSNQRVFINQVITDKELVEKSQNLENALQTGNLIEYCNFKIENSKNQTQSFIWKYILATFEQNKNSKYLELLGFNLETLDIEVKKILKDHHQHHNPQINNLQANLADSFNQINLNGNSTPEHASLFGQTEQNDANDDAFNDIARSISPVNLNFNDQTENLITELLLLGKYETVVDLLVQEERFTEAILIANFFDKNLLLKTQQRYFRHFNKNKFSNLLEKLLNRNWSGIISTCNLSHWKEALATIVTYTNGQEQMDLCDELGKRLESENSQENLINACVCYICSANLENLVNCWQKCLGTEETDTSETLQDLVEKVMILKFCFKNYHPELANKLDQNPKLNSKLVKYAKLLADQGCFLNAYNYLGESSDQPVMLMKDRLFHVLDPMVVQQLRLKKPDTPFKSAHHQVGKTNSVGHNQTSLQARKSSGFQPAPSVPAPQTFNPSSFNQFTQNPPGQYHPPINHPMPLSTIYSSQDLTKRSATPTFPNRPPVFTPQAPSISTIPTQLTNEPHMTPNTGQSFYNPSQSVVQPQQPTSQPPQTQSYMHVKPATAWNDPPMVVPKVKSGPVKTEVEKPAFFQPTMPATAPGLNQFQYQNYQQPLTQTFQPPSQPTMPQYQPPVQQFQPQQVQQQPPVQQLVQPQQPEKPVGKGPIPTEHQELQNVFDSLLNKCLSATNVPTTKRKLEDVAKKLEVLYDKLRDSTLSANVSQNLHTMVQYIRAFDYQSSLQLHAQIVATSNFSEISGFMPGIKVLIQTCQQMNLTI
ncbi:unnamed protein product [Brachionus calyciflorus]|uniref:Sec31 n=1 Tax=Brachionus calyciflorus TaxID=104777 RepID=A0A813RIJ4_9BILA|nr:unnamed protein product [Brachionus calyciflorus]